MFEFSTNGLTKMRAFVSIIIQFRVVFNNCVNINFLISNSLGPELGATMSDIGVVVKKTDLQIVILLRSSNMLESCRVEKTIYTPRMIANPDGDGN